MAEFPSRQKTTDDEVRAILLASGTLAQIAAAVGVHPKVVWNYRKRQSKRALRIARELGLPPLVVKPAMVDHEDSDRAYVIRGVRG